jgi:hypothetical protein
VLLDIPAITNWWHALIMLMLITGFVVVFTRFGVLAFAALAFVYELLTTSPITLDTSAWYFGASLTYLLVVAGLAAYGCVVSLGGRPLFGSGIPDKE